MSIDMPRTIKRILVATGLTPESVGGVLMAKWLAGKLGAEIHAVHVIEPVEADAESAIPGLSEAHANQAQEELELFAQSHGLKGCELHVKRGKPSNEIVALAHDLGTDLLVVGRYGKGGLKRGRLGSIADRLVRKFPVSVLVVPPEFRGEVDRVGVATNLEEHSDLAVRRGAELVTQLGATHLALLNAYLVPAGYHAVCSWDQACERLEGVGRDRAATMIERVKSRSHDLADVLDRASVELGEGHAATVVPQMAIEHNLDLVVVNTHGRSSSAALLMGHTTEKILNNASCMIWAEKSPALHQGFIEALKGILR
jgi:universal stress protein A